MSEQTTSPVTGMAEPTIEDQRAVDDARARHDAAKEAHVAERMAALVRDAMATAQTGLYFLPFTSGGSLYAQDAPEERLSELREAFEDATRRTGARLDRLNGAIDTWSDSEAGDPKAWDLIRLWRAGDRNTLVVLIAQTLRLAYAVEEWSADGSRFLWQTPEDDA